MIRASTSAALRTQEKHRPLFHEEREDSDREICTDAKGPYHYLAGKPRYILIIVARSPSLFLGPRGDPINGQK
jgi:hypothetical protein